MKKEQVAATAATELRRYAEGRLGERAKRVEGAHPSRADTEKLVHELQVHQIELEMQNDELLRSRASLEAALERYSELYDFAPVGYFTLGRDGAIREVNLTGARMLGVPRSELIDRRFGAFVTDTHAPAFDGALAKALERQGTATCDVALRPTGRAPHEAPVVRLTVAANEGGEECRAIAVDVTEQNRAEEQIRALQTMDAIGRLAGGVAHDFNNLLTVVLGNAELALRDAGENAPLRSDLLELKEAAGRAAVLTRQLLAFGRKQVLRPLVVDVNDVIYQLLNMLKRILNPNTELALALDAHLEPVEVDPAQLDRVIVNLVLNARDAMPKGGTLTLTTENVSIDPAHAMKYPMGRPGAFVRLAVRDTGAGMDKATMGRIFEPFFTTKEAGRGNGFGLSTVYGIIKQFGGDVAVHSEVAAGSTFEIYLPRAAASREPAPRVAATSTDHDGGTETVLVVDDEEPLRKVAARMLASAGYTVLVAGSGNEALQKSEQHPGVIDLVLSDVVMPQMTGLALAERLKAVRPSTKVLYMSGYSGDVVDTHGAFDQATFIVKPFTSVDLKRKVREVLGRPEQRVGCGHP